MQLHDGMVRTEMFLQNPLRRFKPLHRSHAHRPAQVGHSTQTNGAATEHQFKQENGSEWRLAIGEWKNGSEWRVASGE